MEYKAPLTHESIRQKFKSQFELVNYAIQMAERFIHSNRAPRVTAENHNPAVIIIEEIEDNRDNYEDIFISDEILPEPERLDKEEMPVPSKSMKSTEKKKARRIFA